MEQRQGGADVACQSTSAPPLDRRRLVQIAAVEQLHRVEGALAVDAVVVSRDDARVLQVAQGEVLAFEEQLRFFPRSGPQSLEGKLLTGRDIARAMNDGGSPDAE